MDARTRHLIALVGDGASLEAAGRLYGLSRERVRQLLKSEGITVGSIPHRGERMRSRRVAAARELAPAVEEMWRAGEPVEQIAVTLGLSQAATTRLLAERVSPAERSGRAAPSKPRFSDERVVKALREAAQILGCTPSMKSYDRLRREGSVEGPAAATIAYRWSWAQACQRAGLPANPRTPGSGPRTYSTQDCRDAIARVAEVLGHRPTLPEYRTHRREGEPSGEAIRLRYGGWRKGSEKLIPTSDVGSTDSAAGRVADGLLRAGLPAEVERFEAELRMAGLSEGTIHSYISGASRFVRWLGGDYAPNAAGTHEASQAGARGGNDDSTPDSRPVRDAA